MIIFGKYRITGSSVYVITNGESFIDGKYWFSIHAIQSRILAYLATLCSEDSPIGHDLTLLSSNTVAWFEPMRPEGPTFYLDLYTAQGC